MNKNLISIIVPIYNVEKYLDKCINSIVHQTYKNIEIILVDDESPDNCPLICDEWAKKDKRIVVLHKKNGGLSDARNEGIKKAKGDYLCFVDSDDFIEEKYLEKLLESLIKHKTDVSQCGINYVDNNNKNIKTIGYDKDILITGRNAIIESLNEHFIENEVVWNKLYKKDIFNEIKFPNGKVHEDEYTTYKILYNEKNISIIKDALYNYRQSDNSIMRSNYSIKKYQDLDDAYNEKILYFKEKKDEVIYDMVIRSYLSNLSNIYIKLKKSSVINPEVYKRIKMDYKFWYKYIIKSRNISLKNKIKVSIFYISPRVYMKLKKYKKR